jgi:hypothetical protein
MGEHVHQHVYIQYKVRELLKMIKVVRNFVILYFFAAYK